MQFSRVHGEREHSLQAGEFPVDFSGARLRLESCRDERWMTGVVIEKSRLTNSSRRVLFEEGWIVAHARIQPTLGTRFGRALWQR